jgi:hypothetical protein
MKLEEYLLFVLNNAIKEDDNLVTIVDNKDEVHQVDISCMINICAKDTLVRLAQFELQRICWENSRKNGSRPLIIRWINVEQTMASKVLTRYRDEITIYSDNENIVQKLQSVVNECRKYQKYQLLK